MMRRKLLGWSMTASWLAMVAGWAGQAPADPLPALLERRLLEPDQLGQEVRRFVEPRLIRLPLPASQSEWNSEARRIRQDTLDQIIYRGVPEAWRQDTLRVDWLAVLPGGPGYRIRKLRYEALPGLWIPALLYEPEVIEGKVPVVLNVNGHDRKGKSADYKQIRCINQAKLGMLALNVEWLGMGQLAGENYLHYRMNQLDLAGVSGLAPFYLSMKRGLDILLSHPSADPDRVAVAGLSGGGWQTIVISALDERVTAANPVAGYSSFFTRLDHLRDLGDSEQTPTDLGTVADYHHLTALRAPRPTLLTYNSKDECCFRAGYALQPLLDSARPFFKLYEKEDWLSWHINDDPGTHNFDRDNREALYRFLIRHFYSSNPPDAREIPSDGEVKSAAELEVPLPASNHDFNSLALEVMRALPSRPSPPADSGKLESWKKERREALASLIRFSSSEITSERIDSASQSGVTAVYWKLRLGRDWTLPAVELSGGSAGETVVMLADAGRAQAAQAVRQLLDQGKRVLAFDPIYLGETQAAERPFLHALLVATVGERPLGLQAGQTAAVVRWAAAQYGTSISLRSDGPRTGLIALVTAALEPAVASLQAQGAYAELAEIILRNRRVDEAPELFCFALLRDFEVSQLRRLTYTSDIRSSR